MVSLPHVRNINTAESRPPRDALRTSWDIIRGTTSVLTSYSSCCPQRDYLQHLRDCFSLIAYVLRVEICKIDVPLRSNALFRLYSWLLLGFTWNVLGFVYRISILVPLKRDILPASAGRIPRCFTPSNSTKSAPLFQPRRDITTGVI